MPEIRRAQRSDWGLCQDDPAFCGDRCARITPDGRRCMDSCHGTTSLHGPGRYVSTGERAIPLHVITHEGHHR